MSDDARTEARRRIANVLHAVHCGCPDYHAAPGEEYTLYEQQAAAALDLFEHDIRQLLGWAHGDSALGAQQLIPTGPMEPVTKESPDA
jgi:hypothetical protein